MVEKLLDIAIHANMAYITYAQRCHLWPYDRTFNTFLSNTQERASWSVPGVK